MDAGVSAPGTVGPGATADPEPTQAREDRSCDMIHSETPPGRVYDRRQHAQPGQDEERRLHATARWLGRGLSARMHASARHSRCRERFTADHDGIDDLVMKV